MSRARARSPRPPSGGPLHWLLALPARLRVRWLVILAVTGAAMALYAHTLMTASPMPPGRAPAESGTAATAAAHR
ncbi:hypothetical protein [Streptomyces sp. NRRL F-5123]|uniref:hypothetical protein n=1 Tax=Streptomyces sp. NRRL F-5123 TaxID=1463856 RepID=UPI0004E19E21|nr:hypothetical protein [Streptomyces sp. NRRL F-5123]